MIEGLRAEIPEVFALAGRIPRPAVPAAGPIIAAAYGLGVQWLTSGLVQGVVFTYLSFATPVLPGQPPIREAIAFLAATAGIAVARRSGGLPAALLLVVFIAAEEASGRIVLAHANAACGATQLGCLQLLQPPPFPWPAVGGALLGLLAARLIRTSGTRRSVALLAAALLAVAFPVVRLLIEPFGQPTGPDAGLKFDIIIAAQIVAAALAGGLLGAGSRRTWRWVTLFAAVYLLPWSYTLKLWLLQPPPLPFTLFTFEVQWQMLIPPLYALTLITAALLGRMVVALRKVRRAGEGSSA